MEIAITLFLIRPWPRYLKPLYNIGNFYKIVIITKQEQKILKNVWTFTFMSNISLLYVKLMMVSNTPRQNLI